MEATNGRIFPMSGWAADLVVSPKITTFILT